MYSTYRNFHVSKNSQNTGIPLLMQNSALKKGIKILLKLTLRYAIVFSGILNIAKASSVFQCLKFLLNIYNMFCTGHSK